MFLVGFTTTSVPIVSPAILALSFVALVPQMSPQMRPPRLPRSDLGLYWRGALALAPAVAIMPKIGGDGVALAPPIFDHSKVAMIDEMTRLGLPPGNPFFGAVGEPRRDWPTTISGISAPPSSRFSRERAAGKPISR